MTTEHDALVRAICEQPDEDTLRLAYADWLDDNRGEMECGRCFEFGGRRVIQNPNPRRGSSAIVICPTCSGTARAPDTSAARAEFIRAQVRLARWSPYAPPPDILEIANSGRVYAQSAADIIGEQAKAHAADRAAHDRRQRNAWAAGAVFHILDHGRASLPPDAVTHLAADGTDRHPRSPEAYVSRGFVSSIAAPMETLCGSARAAFESHPIEEFRPSDVPGLVFRVRRDDGAKMFVRWTLTVSLTVRDQVRAVSPPPPSLVSLLGGPVTPSDPGPAGLVREPGGKWEVGAAWPTRADLAMGLDHALRDAATRLYYAAGDRWPGLWPHA